MKKLLSLVISICIIAGFSTSIYAVDYGEELKNAPTKTYEQKFSDVPENYWAYPYITDMVERGVLNGYEDGTFQPDKPVTRAEAAKMIGYIEVPHGYVYNEDCFYDVSKDSWYAPYVEVCDNYFNKYDEMVNSKLEYFFKPNNFAEREDIVVALLKQIGSNYGIDDMPIIKCKEFSDYSQITESKIPYVEKAINKGYLNGYDDNTIRPHGSITRAEMATLLYKIYGDGNLKDFILEDENYTINCNLDEFITKYNENARNNIINIEYGEYDNFIVEELYMNKTQALVVDSSGDFDGIAYGNIRGGSIIYCNKNGKVIGVDWDLNAFNHNEETFINYMDIYEYDCICVIMSLTDISYDEAKNLLKVVQTNAFANKFGNISLSVENKYSFGRYYDMLRVSDASFLFYDLGLYPSVESSGGHINSNNGNLNELISEYNDAVYSNFKNVTEDLRDISPEYLLLSKNSFFSKKTLSNDIYAYDVKYGKDFYTYNMGNLKILCNSKNEILQLYITSSSILTDKYVNDDKKILSVTNLEAICLIQALENISFEKAKDYYFAVKNGSVFTLSSGNMYKEESLTFKITSTEYYNYLEEMVTKYEEAIYKDVYGADSN